MEKGRGFREPPTVKPVHLAPEYTKLVSTLHRSHHNGLNDNLENVRKSNIRWRAKPDFLKITRMPNITQI